MTSFLDYLEENQNSLSDDTPSVPLQDQQRATALRYARSIQYHRNTQEKVLDLIINTVDLPSHPNADPSRPAASDVSLFKEALILFQPKDIDDMVLERNIYEKCGYAMCPRPNLKQNGALRDQSFQSMKYRKFRLNKKEELEKWCSVECAERALFVRLQVGTEPAWLRSTPVEEIVLLDERGRNGEAEDLVSMMQDLALKESHPIDLASSLQKLALDQSKRSSVQERMLALSTERGENQTNHMSSSIVTGIKEKDLQSTTFAPQNPPFASDMLEGYKPSDVRFGRLVGNGSMRKEDEMNT